MGVYAIGPHLTVSVIEIAAPENGQVRGQGSGVESVGQADRQTVRQSSERIVYSCLPLFLGETAYRLL